MMSAIASPRGSVVLQVPVRVGQHLYVLRAELGCCCPKFAFSDRTESLSGDGCRFSNLPLLAAGGRNDHDFGPCVGRPGYCAAGAKHFVVWVGEDAEQAPG
jgi:hypothetical protein